jgi:hypothetical protein
MSCEHYQRAITDSFAAGGELTRELRAHAETCSACRAALDAESALFSAIDAGLHLRANPELPAGFLSRVRVRLTEQQAAERSRVPPWVAAIALPAAAVLLLVGTLGIHRHSQEPGEIAGPVVQRAPSPAVPSPAQTADVQPAGPGALSRRAVRSAPAVVRPREPEVLVAADGEQSFLRAVKIARSDGQVLFPEVKALDAPLEIKPLELPPLEIDSGEKTGAAPANQE